MPTTKGDHGTGRARLYEQAGHRYAGGRVVSLDGIEDLDGETVVEWEVMVELTVNEEAAFARETLFVVSHSEGGRFRVGGGRTGWEGP